MGYLLSDAIIDYVVQAVAIMDTEDRIKFQPCGMWREGPFAGKPKIYLSETEIDGLADLLRNKYGSSLGDALQDEMTKIRIHLTEGSSRVKLTWVTDELREKAAELKKSSLQ
jgi:hypothetical protein